MASSLPTANPFADPSVQQAARSVPIPMAEEANPFTTGVNGGGGGGPSVPAGATVVSEEELFRRQEELKRREQELQRRQREFEQRQAAGGGGGARVRPPHNWPPLPAVIPLEPCFYQDIDVEIPPQFQETVRLIYNVYLVYILALAANLIGSLFYFLFAEGGFGHLFLAIIELGIFTPCAYMLWFRPVYKAFRDDSSFNFLVFFAVLFFHAGFTFFQGLGITDYACGWVNTFDTLGKHLGVGLVMLLPTLAFTAAFLGMAYSLVCVHRFYRGGTAPFSLNKAREEFSRGVMNDRNVQQGMNAAGRAAAAHVVNETVNGRF